MENIYVLYVELCMKWRHLSALKGNNSYENVQKRIILESSRNLQMVYCDIRKRRRM